jgi:uncharacterized small protein (DUF1192 family)
MHRILAILILLSGLMSAYSQAGVVPTHDILAADEVSYSTAELRAALDSAELQEQLSDMGVDTAQLAERIASLTPAEIQQLNAELENQPAGGIIGVLLTIFIIFIITDMLCATDIFGFVKCINK